MDALPPFGIDPVQAETLRKLPQTEAQTEGDRGARSGNSSGRGYWVPLQRRKERGRLFEFCSIAMLGNGRNYRRKKFARSDRVPGLRHKLSQIPAGSQQIDASALAASDSDRLREGLASLIRSAAMRVNSTLKSQKLR